MMLDRWLEQNYFQIASREAQRPRNSTFDGTMTRARYKVYRTVVNINFLESSSTRLRLEGKENIAVINLTWEKILLCWVKNEGRRRRIKGKNGNGLRCNRSKDELHFNDNVRNREREKGIRDRKEREKGNGRIDRELNFISFSKGRNERKRGEGKEKKKKTGWEWVSLQV